MMIKRLAALSALSLAMSGLAQADGLSHLPLLSEVAPDAVSISPHVPHMGVHWAEPANLPNGGPIYCEIDGRVVCVEYIFPAEMINGGTDITGLLTGMETPPITHIDWEYKPDGVGGSPDPVYQLHIYFADKDVLAAH
jgi:hypothetical protein